MPRLPPRRSLRACRILQCCRRAVDESNPQLHVANVGKYLAGGTALIVRTLHERSLGPHQPAAAATAWLAAAVLASAASSAYSFVWDLYYDWGLLRTKCSTHRGLRRLLMLENSPWGARAAAPKRLQ